MVINDKEVSINQLIDELEIDKDLLKKRANGLVLSDNTIMVLERYNIDYKKFSNIKALIFEIETCLNEDDSDYTEELERVEEQLAEYDYYYNTNK